MAVSRLFNPLCDDLKAQLAGKIHKNADKGPVLWIDIHVLHKPAIDLDHIHVECLQRMQGHVAAAKIIQSNPCPKPLERPHKG